MEIGKILSKRALISPHRRALIFQNKVFTYLDLERRTNGMAQALIKLDVKPGDRVAILMRNCNQYIELFFATARIGAVLVPLNTRLTPAELDYILKDCGVSVIICGEGFEKKVSKLKTLPQIRVKISTAQPVASGTLYYETLIETDESWNPEFQVKEDDLLAIMYTSGTTGYPKGVMLTHEAIYHAALNLMIGLDYQYPDKCLIFIPLFHTGASTPIIGHFIKGICTVLMENFEPIAALKLIEQHKVKFILGVTAIMRMLMDVPTFKDFNLDSWKLAILPGSPLPSSLIKAAHDRFGVQCQNLWGMTEIGGPGALMNVEDIMDKPECAGKPYFEVDLKIIDPEGKALPAGEPGELLVRGPNMMLGYWNQPEATRTTIRNGWIHSGDIGYIDAEGYLHVIDRMKDMIVSGGENVYPAEIEKVILEIPGIEEASVIGIPDDKWGEAPKAFIVLTNTNTPSNEEIIQHCRKKLAGYKIPRHIEKIDELPKNASGKVLKKILRA